jgi:hypothetical protein
MDPLSNLKENGMLFITTANYQLIKENSTIGKDLFAWINFFIIRMEPFRWSNKQPNGKNNLEFNEK